MMDVMCVVFVTAMSSDILLPHKEIGNCPSNEHFLFASRIYVYKKMVSQVNDKASVITFL